jgi:pimeloyl-ACP methyl ester carboxylesterase
MREKVIPIGSFKTVVGIVSEPGAPTTQPAVLLLNAGLIHRVGPNRIYVKLARALVAQGYLTLRLDLSGIGDSLPRPDHMPVEKSTIDDTVQAMNALAEIYGVQEFVLMGHCAGAYHSFRTACQDSRVRGVVMMNPEGGEADWVAYDRQRKLARYYEQYYGRRKLLDPQTWQRLLRGQVSLRNVAQNLFRNILWNRMKGAFFKIKNRLAPPPPTEADRQLFTVEAIIRKLPEVEARVLMIYSEGATSLERTQMLVGQFLKKMRQSGRLQLEVISGADHTFTLLDSQARLIEVIKGWL